MSSVTITRETVVIRCPDCGGTRQISVRQRRRIRNSRVVTSRCSICRTIKSPAEVTKADRDFWLDRYPMEWIREVADAIWGGK